MSFLLLQNYCDLMSGVVDEKVLKDMYEDVDAVIDTPALFFWKDLMEMFPEAKVFSANYIQNEK